MSLRDLADEMGVPSHHVWRRLNGETPLTLGDLDAMAKALNLPVSHFLPASESVA
jgi:transcriptional regulator with XRE-family HTH domain